MYEDNLATGAAVTAKSSVSQAAYKPNKADRVARRKVYERFFFMRDDGLRKDAEDNWEIGDKMFGQDIPTPDADDWRAHLVLPDAFAGVQSHMQETIDRNSRPYLRRVEDSDRSIECFQNQIMTHNINRTGYDYQYFLAKYSASIRGTAYLWESYRVDKRTVKDPTDVNPDGTLKYTDKEIIDFDDTYTEWVPNEFIFIDAGAKHVSEAIDCIRREILDVDEFKRAYAFRKDFKNLDLVQRGGDLSTNSFFKFPLDLNSNQVEVLHYYNRADDQYIVTANWVVVHSGPIPYKHKELPVTPIFHYMIPGRMYGMGVPQVIRALSEERASIRNLNLDRQKMHINKMFLINDQVDFDDEELITRPHGFVEISTNGANIRDAVMPLEYGDVPSSAFKTEEILQEDIRRATGIDDRVQGVQTGGTATEASFLKESSQKRINLIAKIAEMDSIVRIGRLKWSNIQFFYPAPRIERITQDNEEREKKVYKKVQTEGHEFKIVKNAKTGKSELQDSEIEGYSMVKLDASYARYMEGDYDVTVDVESATVVSKVLKQAKTTEMVNGLTANPMLMGALDPRKVVKEVLEVNDFSAKRWMRDNGLTDADQMMKAEDENLVMAKGVMLDPTEGANEVHTLVHLQYTKSTLYENLPEGAKAIFLRHIAGEHEKNPNTGSVAEALGAPGGGGPPGPVPTPDGGVQIQPADITPSTVTGGEANAATSNAPLLNQ